MNTKVPFGASGREVKELGQGLRDAVDGVLNKGWFILGAEVEAFEKEFASWLGASETIGVASGTDAITLALMALGVGPGDEVITVANTCIPTATGILRSGAACRLADCDPGTLMISVESVRKAITPRTKAIVPVNLYGSACELALLRQLADVRGIFLMEDCAQSTGTRHTGRTAGTFGHAASFSFYPSKNLGAYGDGGAVVTSDPAVAARARLLRNYGKFDRDRSSVVGLNSRLDELQAAILRVKLGHVSGWNERRRVIASRYTKGLAGTGIVFPATDAAVIHSFHLFVIQVPPSDRDRIHKELASSGVDALIHYPTPLHLQPALAALGYKKGDFPAAERACDSIISLPMFPQLTDQEVDKVVSSVKKALR